MSGRWKLPSNAFLAVFLPHSPFPCCKPDRRQQPVLNARSTYDFFELFLQAAACRHLCCLHSWMPVIPESGLSTVQIPPAIRKSNFMDTAKFVWCVGGLIHEDHCLLSTVIQALFLQGREAGTWIFSHHGASQQVSRWDAEAACETALGRRSIRLLSCLMGLVKGFKWTAQIG